jgi:hypothetical protein
MRTQAKQSGGGAVIIPHKELMEQIIDTNKLSYQPKNLISSASILDEEKTMTTPTVPKVSRKKKRKEESDDDDDFEDKTLKKSKKASRPKFSILEEFIRQRNEDREYKRIEKKRRDEEREEREKKLIKMEEEKREDRRMLLNILNVLVQNNNNNCSNNNSMGSQLNISQHSSFVSSNDDDIYPTIEGTCTVYIFFNF